MPEYIEREAAIKFVKELMEEVNNKTAINGSYVTKTYDMAIRHATKLLRYVPTAYPKADVVEVVRCKDCAIPHNRFTGCPNLNGLIPPENHFCSFGERKEDDTE